MTSALAPERPPAAPAAGVARAPLPPYTTVVFRSFLAGSAVLAGLLVAGPAPVQDLAGLAGILGALSAVWYGALRVAVPADRRPWVHMGVAGLLFLAGMVMRAVVPGASDSPPTLQSLWPDAFVVPGYLVMGYAFASMLRRRRAADDDPARSDALLVGAAAAFMAWTFVMSPTIDQSGIDPIRVANAFFPVIDVVLMMLVAQLALAGGARTPALWLLIAGSTAMFIGDLLFMLRDNELANVPLTAINTLFTGAFLLFGAGTLHPSMRTLTEPQQVIVRVLGMPRMITIALLVAVPVVMTTVQTMHGVVDGAVRATLCVLMIMAVLFRVVRSNDSRARAESAGRRRATHDALTDLPNRELLSETITAWGDRARDQQQEISLLFIDLDRFKMINDHWGHQVGDELLCAVAGRLGAIVRSTDLVCRIGGDEFVIALASPSHSATAESLAARVLAEFERPFELSVGSVVVSASIGVAKTTGGAEALELIRDADTAMYKAKGSGRNAYALFDSSLRDEVRDRLLLEQALRGALERGELYATYQPIVDLATGEREGFETLMRWEHPELGAVSPLRFIPIAEETGLIVEAGAWLLRESVHQLAAWRAAAAPGTRPLHVSVNVSVRQLRDKALVGVVRDVLAETGLPPEALWLEITESGVMEDLATALATLDELHALGVVMAVDDFGTGYSSLSYLNRLPVGVVKLDRSFVSSVGTGGTDEQIVRAVLALAGALGLRVVAEGVETDLQRDWLVEQGCELGQGWLFGKPLRASAFITS
ncbi:putative bifunctional diguanylate cyclase/phosphodiesterase [Actinoplanes sp. RD1]|uniref:putative bifunctional diguanylate cyclase/phosphodiesterase n=1 Tax=Actinoplanes sp. RD1 TaxID=3064538 RepID=UPI0027404764|nr:EAL domain-containing protein [Actinoplanes sp. RD1]